jgi:hypothetical protein
MMNSHRKTESLLNSLELMLALVLSERGTVMYKDARLYNQEGYDMEAGKKWMYEILHIKLTF